MALGTMVLIPWGNTFLAEAGFHEEPIDHDSTVVSDLSHISIDELMKVEIVSLAKTPRPLSESGAAVFVNNQEDFRRSGVTSIPEALRMAPGINVARIDSNKWAITARGFNDRYGSKLLVIIDGRTI